MTKRFGLRLAAGSVVVGAITLGALGSATASADVSIDPHGDGTATVTVGGIVVDLGNGSTGGGVTIGGVPRINWGPQ